LRAQVERIDHNRQEATLELPQGRFSQDLILHIIQVRKNLKYSFSRILFWIV
jgi:transcription antitermination factor NusG